MASEIIQVKLQTHIGGRKENQDCASALDTKLGKVILVCDGMGGAKGGAVASELAIKVIKDAFDSADDKQDPKIILRRAIENANIEIFSQSQNNENLRGMGTTLAGVLVNKNMAIVFHVGDSRVYLVRGNKIVYKTVDHSFVSEQLAAGLISEKEAMFHPRGNEITRALGIKKTVDFEVKEIGYKKGDKFILSSDGIHGEIIEEDLLDIIKSNTDLEQVASRIIKQADIHGRKRKNGKHDNMTIAIGETLVSSKTKIVGPINKNSNNKKWPYLLVLPMVLGLAYFGISFLSNQDSSPEKADFELELKNDIANENIEEGEEKKVKVKSNKPKVQNSNRVKKEEVKKNVKAEVQKNISVRTDTKEAQVPIIENKTSEIPKLQPNEGVPKNSKSVPIKDNTNQENIKKDSPKEKEKKKEEERREEEKRKMLLLDKEDKEREHEIFKKNQNPLTPEQYEELKISIKEWETYQNLLEKRSDESFSKLKKRLKDHEVNNLIIDLESSKKALEETMQVIVKEYDSKNLILEDMVINVRYYNKTVEGVEEIKSILIELCKKAGFDFPNGIKKL